MIYFYKNLAFTLVLIAICQMVFSQTDDDFQFWKINQKDEHGHHHGFVVIPSDSGLNPTSYEKASFVYLAYVHHGRYAHGLPFTMKKFELTIDDGLLLPDSNRSIVDIGGIRQELIRYLDYYNLGHLKIAEGTFYYTYANCKSKLRKDDSITVVFNHGVPQYFYYVWSHSPHFYLLYDFNDHYNGKKESCYKEHRTYKRLEKGYIYLEGKKLKRDIVTIKMPDKFSWLKMKHIIDE